MFNKVTRAILIYLVFTMAVPVSAIPRNSPNGATVKHQTDSVKDPALQAIIDGVFELYQFLRNDIGVYADAARFGGEQFHPCSIASVGMGLVSLCIADTLQLDDNAENMALQTLQAMSGNAAGFMPARNAVNGFFRHWINKETGQREWNSEYSSIDTGILVCGALFCKMYFNDNKEIARLADALYLSVDWNAAMANAGSGEIYMTFNENGRGELKTRPFNEYMIVAWLATNDPRADVRTKQLWKNHYESASSPPTSTYEGIRLLTDAPGQFLSNFVLQFPHYLCHYFTTRPDYQNFYRNAQTADRLWWSDKTEFDYIWGTGAGASGFVGSGYHADNFNNNPGTVCSPHIIAGFSPIDSSAINNLVNLWQNNLGVYTVPNSTKKFLWRFSLNDKSWRADDVQGVDISTLLFGIAAYPSILGPDFFSIHNNFDFPDSTLIKKKSDPIGFDHRLNVKIYPNPFNTSATIRYTLHHSAHVNIDLYDIRGQFITSILRAEQNAGVYDYIFEGTNLSSGLYVAQVRAGDLVAFARLHLVK